MAFSLLGNAQAAVAYEYPLQFKANPRYRSLVVAGYKFNGSGAVGNCSYYTRCRAPTWDMHGNRLSITPGALAVPKPTITKGSRIIYAIGWNGEYTGTDSKLPDRGFVSSPGSHYTWLRPNHNLVLQQIAYSRTATLKTDGDMPVDISHSERHRNAKNTDHGGR